MSVLCRLCMKSCQLYADASADKIGLILQRLFAIRVEPTDVSKVVCDECLNVITEFYSFYKRVKIVQKKFSENCLNNENENFVLDENVESVKCEYVAIKEEPVEYSPVDERSNAKFLSEKNAMKNKHFSIDEVHNVGNSALNDTKEKSNDSFNFSDSSDSLDYSEDAKIDTWIPNKKIKLENNSSASKTNFSFPSEIIKNGKWVINGPTLENLIRNFYNLECSICKDKVVYLKLFELLNHYKTEHQTRGYVTCCNSKLYKRNTICSHMAQHLQPSAFQCPVCQKTIARLNAMKIHMKTHLPEPEKLYKCDQCDKRYSRPKSLTEHKMTVHTQLNENETTECEICKKTFPLHFLYIRHMTSVHSKSTVVCSICGKIYNTNHKLKMHMLIHDDPEKHKVKCPECGVMLKNKMSLQQHLKIHSDNFFKCTLCEFTTPYRKQLKPHMLVKHSDVKPVCCDVCGKRFKLKVHLKVHMAQHTGERKYVCSFCPKTFASAGNCYTHRKRMHPEEYKNLLKTKQNDAEST